MNIRRQILISLILLALTLVIFDYASIDVWLQNYFYDPTATTKEPLERWLIYKHEPIKQFWLHSFVRYIIIAMGSGFFIAFLGSFYVKSFAKHRYVFLFLLCCFVLVGVLASGVKEITNVYCPNQLANYGGNIPYVKVMGSYPDGFQAPKSGRCFPAGHATAGFSFMALYFVFRKRSHRIASIAFGITAGWALGIFQMLRGEHFLSHTIFSMIQSWVIILIIFELFRKFGLMQLPAGSDK